MTALAAQTAEIERLRRVVDAARDVRNRYLNGDGLTRGPWVEIAVLDMAFKDYDTAPSANTREGSR